MVLHASTIIARAPSTIVSYLNKISSKHAKDSIVFTLSANSPDLSTLVSQLTALSPSHIGCLTSPTHGDTLSCSIAAFSRNEVTSFRSTIPGRAEPQVGRWHAFREKEAKAATSMIDIEENKDGSIKWEDVWDRNVGPDVLPAELKALSPDTVTSMIYFSDLAPEGLLNSITTFSNATQVGLLASSTPFVTGRPVTLFRDNEIFSSGAVGLCSTTPHPPTVNVDFPSLLCITPPLKITRSEGNLVNTLDDANPTRLLLNAISKHGINSNNPFKEDEFYLGVVDNGQLSEVYRIMSGDPSRGTIALQSPSAPPEGSVVQVYVHLVA
ncbi:hypothetical protein BJ138DRAFT_997911 [Hygrophoropsis aurantiaca]|uniref:Uncharacterized protein n=1 Tax=Hygrophoropsis aurantiaca TaxID=72124 RepID=A0ACB8AQG5_9AGAM|nr:hypothetical protein BJ138DRAFT_997911 [Hygrophoropsis aurantiaca]